MPSGTTKADGAFDVVGIGRGPGSTWPDAESALWAHRPDPTSTWILDETGHEARTLLHAFGEGTAFSIAPFNRGGADRILNLPLTPGRLPQQRDQMLGMHVPVNPLAVGQRHMGLGFTDYILVLTDRPRKPPNKPPTGAVAWLTSRFHKDYVVVIEGGAAAAWRGRALRGVVGVHTRTDLWRLLAHARVTVDLSPGDVIARECIESLRLGTPIVVPEDSVGAEHAKVAGGLAYSDVLGLLDHVASMSNEEFRRDRAEEGREYADTYYGEQSHFIENLARCLGWQS